MSSPQGRRAMHGSTNGKSGYRYQQPAEPCSLAQLVAVTPDAGGRCCQEGDPLPLSHRYRHRTAYYQNDGILHYVITQHAVKKGQQALAFILNLFIQRSNFGEVSR